MKLIHSLLFAALALPGLAFSQAGSVSTVTLALSLTYTSPGAAKKDEEGKTVKVSEGGGPVYGNEWTAFKKNSLGNILSEEQRKEVLSKFGTYKYSNKEFLADMIRSGRLPGIGGREPAISGWSLIATQGIASPTGPGAFYVRHSSGVAVDVTSEMKWQDEAANWAAFNQTLQDAQNSVYDPKTAGFKESRTTTHTINLKSTASVSLFNDWIKAYGIYTAGTKLTRVSLKGEDGESQVNAVYIPTAAKLGSLSGYSILRVNLAGDMYYDSPTIVEGSIALGAGKVWPDMAGYLSPPD